MSSKDRSSKSVERVEQAVSRRIPLVLRRQLADAIKSFKPLPTAQIRKYVRRTQINYMRFIAAVGICVESRPRERIRYEYVPPELYTQLRELIRCKHALRDYFDDPTDYLAGPVLKQAKLLSRKRGGQTTAQIKKEEKEAHYVAVVNKWHQLAGMPEFNRASAIARALGLTPRTVRNHLKEARVRGDC